MAFQPWIPRGQSPARRIQAHSFNGAMAFQPWILDCAGPSPAGPWGPSMGPWPFSHGYARPGACLARRKRLQWGHGLSAMDTGQGLRRMILVNNLQWGHGLSAMDTALGRRRGGRRVYAFNGAMAFQPWIRRVIAILGTATRSFNGAMAFQPWILCPRRPAGPARSSFNGAMAFQPWILLRQTQNSGIEDPSMGPWPFSHGYFHGTTLDTKQAYPSMGPWPFSHGYGKQGKRPASLPIPFNGAMAFQPWIRLRLC